MNLSFQVKAQFSYKSTNFVPILFQNAGDIYKILNKVFLVFPPFALGDGLLTLTLNQARYELMEDFFDEDTYENPLQWNLLGLNIFVMVIQTLIFHLLNLALEYKWLQRIFK